MLTNTNLTIIQGNLVRDAEYNENLGLINFSIAVDYAGNEKDGSSTGYFDVKMWVRESEHSAAATVKRIKSAVTDGKLVKGSKVAITGRLSQERWRNEDNKVNSRIVIIAEDMNVLFANDKVAVGAGASSSNSNNNGDWIDQF